MTRARALRSSSASLSSRRYSSILALSAAARSRFCWSRSVCFAASRASSSGICGAAPARPRHAARPHATWPATPRRAAGPSAASGCLRAELLELDREALLLLGAQLQLLLELLPGCGECGIQIQRGNVSLATCSDGSEHRGGTERTIEEE